MAQESESKGTVMSIDKEGSVREEQKGSLKHVIEAQLKATLSWKDINVYANNASLCDCVRRGSTEDKHIIKNISGELKFGRLLAIMGSSSAGKTTLLNVLSGREMNGFRVEGTVAINGQVTDQSSIKSLSAYVQQQDIFLGNLTVREHLHFQASRTVPMACHKHLFILQSLLRIDGSLTDKQRSSSVNELMVELELNRCSDNYIGGIRQKGISGGERKRVALASEIIGNPSILFLDEPTSGLDSHIAVKTVRLLGKLSAAGQTVICTIHQPSSEIFTIFDELLLICGGGRAAYMGSIADAKVFFASQGYTIPAYFNPADVYIRTLAVDSDNIDECTQRNIAICNAYLLSPFAKKVNIDTSKPQLVSIKFKATFWIQFFVLLCRTWKNNVRENIFWYLLCQELITSTIYGYLFSGQTLTPKGVKNLNNAIFFLVFTLLYQLCYVEVRMFFEEIDLLYRELDSNLYSVTSYFWAFTIAAIPYQILAAAEFSIIFYVVVGFGGDIIRFGNYLLTSVIMSQAVMSFVYLLCCICLDMILTLKVVTTLFGLLFILSGTIIDFASLPTAILSMKLLSMTYLGNEAYVLNQWHKVDNISCEVLRFGDRPVNISYNRNATDQRINCYTGAKVIESFNYSPDNFELNNVLLLIFVVVYRILANIVLSFRLKRF